MLSTNELLQSELGIDKNVLAFCESALNDILPQFSHIDEVAEYNQLKVLRAMQKNKLSDVHFAATTGYGYNDLGRDVLERIYADVFKAEDALVRPQIISGTHALTVALFGNLRYGDELLSPVGKPYDTLEGVIGIRETRGSLKEHGIKYRQVDLTTGGEIDYDGIKAALSDKTKLITIQRSKGYAWRHSFTTDEIKELIAFIKAINPNVICMVDNCYGEFVDFVEPCELGADLAVGSLIKNPGGGLAPVGGYIVGKSQYVENAAYRLTAPGLGKEVGPTLGITQSLIQGLFLAPQVVAGSLKGAVFAARIFEKLGFDVLPGADERRSDIVQAIAMNSPENVIKFCQGIQKAAPVDSYVVPEPWDMPGYDAPVIMAAGAFVQGSSIELSADAPIKEPYAVYLQGGLTWHHAKAGILIATVTLYKNGCAEKISNTISLKLSFANSSTGGLPALTFATIGTSSITKAFIKAATSHNRWQYNGAYSRSLANAKSFVEDFPNVTCYDDLELMAASGIDAVYIASPNSIHFEQAKFFLQRKIHVICEKPICTDLQSFEELVKIAADNDVFVLEALRHIHMPSFEIIKEQIKNIGAVRQLNLHYCKYSSRYDDYKNGKITNIFSLEYGGGALMDLGVYPISFCAALFGAPKNSSYNAVKLSNGVDGCGALVMEYDGFTATINCSKITTSVIPNEILGETGAVIINHITEQNEIIVTDKSGMKKNVSVPLLPELMTYEAEAFYNIIATKDRKKYLELQEISRSVMQVLDRSRAQL